MMTISKTEMYKRTNQQLGSLAEIFRREAASGEQRRQKACAVLKDIRTVQGSRRTIRPNL